MRTVYVNGKYLPESEAVISVFDRGFLFADGVYEVSPVLRGRLIDNDAHLARLHRSMNAIDLNAPVSDAEIVEIQKTLIEKNALNEGLIYFQVTRGAADRDFVYPARATPSLVIFTQAKNVIDTPQAKTGLKVITTPDIRWARRDIKATGLLAPCIAKTAATRAGADDAWMVEDGFVTEGSSNNVYILTGDNTLVTHQLGTHILAGITREGALRIANQEDIRVEERPFSVTEALAAKEAFVTSATTFVTAVVAIDGQPIGNGKPGPITQQLRQHYIDAALATT